MTNMEFTGGSIAAAVERFAADERALLTGLKGKGERQGPYLQDRALSSPNVAPCMVPEFEALRARVDELEAAVATFRADLSAVAEMTIRAAEKATGHAYSNREPEE